MDIEAMENDVVKNYIIRAREIFESDELSHIGRNMDPTFILLEIAKMIQLEAIKKFEALKND